MHQLDRVLQGDLDEFTEALTADDQRRALGRLSDRPRGAVAEAERRLGAAGVDTPRLDAELLVAHALGLTPHRRLRRPGRAEVDGLEPLLAPARSGASRSPTCSASGASAG